jgi:hypothetical protein
LIHFFPKNAEKLTAVQKNVGILPNGTYNLTMFEEIDGIQSEINKLNRLCDDSLGAAFASEPADDKTRRWERLGVFILKLLDGVLERRYILRLEKWLLADAEARRYYVDFMLLTALLHLYYHPDRYKKTGLADPVKP